MNPQYKIYDAHTHIFPDMIAGKATDSIGDFYKYPMHAPAMVKALLEEGETIGTKGYLVCSSAVTPRQVEHINKFIISACKAHPSFVGLAAMHPGYENPENELDKAVENGLVGVKFHPDFQHFNIDDESAIPLYREIARRGLIVLFHMGDHRYDYSAPRRLAAVMEKVPELKVHAAHFGGHRCWEQVKCLERGNPNLWFDTSSTLFWLEKEKARELIDYFGYDRFFFGTDFPMWSSKEELDRFLALGLPEEQNAAILGENFEKLYLNELKK